MGTSEAPPTSPTPSAGPATGFDRRALVLSAALLLVVIVGGIVAVTVTSDAGDRKENRLQEGEIPPAEAIPQPGRGRAPENPGDRGGSEQLGLLAVMVAAITGIGVVIFWGGKNARANRARWMAAGADATDEHVDEVSTATGTRDGPPATDDPVERPAP